MLFRCRIFNGFSDYIRVNSDHLHLPDRIVNLRAISYILGIIQSTMLRFQLLCAGYGDIWDEFSSLHINILLVSGGDNLLQF